MSTSGILGNLYYSVGSQTSTTASQNYYTTYQPPSTMDVKGDLLVQGKLIVKGKSIDERLEIIEDRLSIITNLDPKKLEKYAALKKAYENYKLMEKLLKEDDEST